MTQPLQASNTDSFLAQVCRQAEQWPLRVLPLEGGLVLLREGLSGGQRQRLLALLSREIAPPGLLMAADTTGWNAHTPVAPPVTEQGEDYGVSGHCQVTVEERQQLFSCFQADN
ncbi:hypothetical protein [Desulfurivibrio alkaliphilus]|uniref:Uncharacterized protein n=1 Tax=Desulfurivibrio alkaliphilus (strain DSM 19089 / UNIQEM U267 / AHT2) TaxID=589865 RepID=D6Z4U3_DESAT|nr:hypothetical protein [Desulfurivibrio alkaliphilus]ADH86568.1 hypothetical protein DaAHT2_1888 [Desulfurivibrio alkaliphilus AHT 2]